MEPPVNFRQSMGSASVASGGVTKPAQAFVRRIRRSSTGEAQEVPSALSRCPHSQRMELTSLYTKLRWLVTLLLGGDVPGAVDVKDRYTYGVYINIYKKRGSMAIAALKQNPRDEILDSTPPNGGRRQTRQLV